jgi:hypothetical protein
VSNGCWCCFCWLCVHFFTRFASKKGITERGSRTQCLTTQSIHYGTVKKDIENRLSQVRAEQRCWAWWNGLKQLTKWTDNRQLWMVLEKVKRLCIIWWFFFHTSYTIYIYDGSTQSHSLILFWDYCSIIYRFIIDLVWYFSCWFSSRWDIVVLLKETVLTIYKGFEKVTM